MPASIKDMSKDGFELREISADELERVSGGMKWTPTDNPDVIDARGGSGPFLWGLRWAFGPSGFRIYRPN